MPAISSILLATGIAAGAATSIYGLTQQQQGTQEMLSAQQQQIAAEQKQEEQRKQAMELDARRKLLETVRNQQKARANALTAATNQGANLGSGLQGGYGQISGDTGTSLLGINQNLQIGENMFGLSQNISNARLAMAAAQSRSAYGSGLMSFGSTIMNSAQAFSRFATPSASYSPPGYGASSMSYTSGNPTKYGTIY